MFYVCCVCPSIATPVPDGYELSKEERAIIVASMVGIPITVQHHCIADQIKNIPDQHLRVPAHLAETLSCAGTVLSAWVTADGSIRAIFFVHDNLQLVQMLIAERHLAAVSLTHVIGKNIPVELSLCSVPARPGSVILHSTKSLQSAYDYKARVELACITSAMSESSPLSLILQGLPDCDRTLITARFQLLGDAVAKARDEKVTAEASLEEMQRIKAVDTNLFKHHLDALMASVPDETRKMFELHGDSTFDVLKEAPPQVMHTMANVVKCASHQMSAMQHGTRSLKRKSEPEQMAQEPVKMEESDLSPLQRALADQFSP